MTYFDTNNVNTYLIVFGQVIWFVNLIIKLLINPNQCFTFGVMICDDPTNMYRSIGIDTNEILFYSI